MSPRALVTGGGGFLGLALIRLLRQHGWQVRSLARGRYPALTELAIEQIRADLADQAAVTTACADCDVVFHVAAKAGIWGQPADFERANVLGTQHILRACRHQRVRRLVYTSSPSVVFSGRDLAGVNESIPYPSHYEADYPRTKALAEQQVLAANDAHLATVALRPHLIWGPGDNHLVPRILARGRAGRLRRLGSGNPLVDSLYIDNAAEAHLLAAERLAIGSPIAGKAYFLSQGEPWPLWDLVDAILAAGALPPVRRQLPVGLAYTAGYLLEQAYRLLHLPGEPVMTRFLARELSTAHWFDISAARHDLGYAPRISICEGLQRLAVALAENPPQER